MNACLTCGGTQIVKPYWSTESECTSETCPDCRYMPPQEVPPSAETVNHPAHYGGDTTYEVIKVIEAWKLGFCLGNAVKYIGRAGKKNESPLEDLKKAAWYLNREIQRIEALD